MLEPSSRELLRERGVGRGMLGASRARPVRERLAHVAGKLHALAHAQLARETLELLAQAALPEDDEAAGTLLLQRGEGAERAAGE